VLPLGALAALGAASARTPSRPPPGPAAAPTQEPAVSRPASDRLEDVERQHILAILNATHWVIGGPQGAAARLGVKRSTLHFRMKKLGIERNPREVVG
jgi:transcriptional regulator with GAF, ATPase, and Fis domain